MVTVVVSVTSLAVGECISFVLTVVCDTIAVYTFVYRGSVRSRLQQTLKYVHRCHPAKRNIIHRVEVSSPLCTTAVPACSKKQLA